jgi:hypothetical protein
VLLRLTFCGEDDVRSAQPDQLGRKMMKETMTNFYAMRRANGDWFALEDHARLLVPLFRSSHDALMARLRNFEMLLFDPVALDARLLKELTPAGAGSDVAFCLINDPFANLRRGSHIERAHIASVMSDSNVLSGNGFHGTGLDHAASVH